jgi:organic radical activating enzyme
VADYLYWQNEMDGSLLIDEKCHKNEQHLQGCLCPMRTFNARSHQHECIKQPCFIDRNRSKYKNMNKQIRTLCRNLLTLTGTWRLAHFVRHTMVADMVRNTIRRRRMYINKDNKIILPQVEIYITKSCNLKCEHCASFNPFRKGIVPTDDVVKTIKQWSNRILPQRIYLLGGEPLLHHDYEEIALQTHNAWKKSTVVLITNGILLPKVRDEFLKLIATNNIEFRISRHINTDNYNANLKEVIQRLIKYNVKYEVIESHKSWLSCHSLDDSGMPCSPQSDPQKSWTHCLSKSCTTIHDNQLCRCSVLLNMMQAVDEGVLPLREFGDICNHKLVSIDRSNDEILRYLHGDAMKECRFCPENFVNIEARQIPAEKLRHIQQIISEKNQEFSNSSKQSQADNEVNTRIAG